MNTTPTPFRIPSEDLSAIYDTIGSLWNQFKDKRIFISGGTGFIGKWLLGSLLHADEKLGLNCQIMILSRQPFEFIKNNPCLEKYSNIDFCSGDIKDFDYPQNLFDYIVHAATDVSHPDSSLNTFDTCVQGTRRILDFAKQCKAQKFLLVSSGAVYGQLTGLKLISESDNGIIDILDPHTAYAQGKRASEWLASNYSSSQLNIKIARCFAFIGPHLPIDSHFAVGNFIRNVLNNEDITIVGDGSPYRSYMYASDMVIWLWTILLKGDNMKAYNIGDSESVSIKELAQRIGSMTHTKVLLLGKKFDSLAPNSYVPNVEKAKKELKLSNTIQLNESIKKYLSWCKEEQIYLNSVSSNQVQG